MKLFHPFSISARLLPAIAIGRGPETVTVSLDRSGFVLDGPFGEHKVADLNLAPSCRTVESAFETLLSFMSAAAESFQYAERRGRDGMDGENSDLFPREVTEALVQVSDEIGMMEFELQSAIEAGERLVVDND
tara:strand:+ start:191 stop:589 length:399 start_codon:yes stop_codon:yes gene_type:complete